MLGSEAVPNGQATTERLEVWAGRNRIVAVVDSGQRFLQEMCGVVKNESRLEKCKEPVQIVGLGLGPVQESQPSATHRASCATGQTGAGDLRLSARCMLMFHITDVSQEVASLQNRSDSVMGTRPFPERPKSFSNRAFGQTASFKINLVLSGGFIPNNILGSCWIHKER